MSDGYECPDNDDYEQLEDESDVGYTSPPRNNLMTNPRLSKKGTTTFVTIDDIKQLIQKKCEEITEILGIPEDDAIILYAYYKWRKDLVESKYLEDQENIRKKAGIDQVVTVPLPTTDEITCSLCFETKPKSEFDGLKCNHILCKDCWIKYIEYNVTRLENLFFWKCPQESCNVVVPSSFNKRYLKEEHEALYNKKMAVAYADSSKSMRWCPAPDCSYGSEVDTVFAKCVECPCGTIYCFKCGMEDHRPCNCDEANEWLKKNGSEVLNAKWFLAYTKDCPKCRKPIEKNQGYHLMICQHPGCNHEFCWLCRRDWKAHSTHFNCTRYDNMSPKEKAKMKEDEQKKRDDFQKYALYLERYMNNAQAIERVNKLMKALKSEEEDLSHNLSLTLTQVEFIQNACQVLRNSKRTLKWSYTYMFHLDNELQRNLYEIIQENLDMRSSELHVLLEKEYPIAKTNIKDFTIFKEKAMAAIFKCNRSLETFLEKKEEFETVVLEEQMEKIEVEKPKSMLKMRNTAKRMASNVSTDSESGQETQRVKRSAFEFV